MKINFDDNSFIELKLAGPGKVLVALGAKDGSNPLNTVVNSAEITLQQLAELVQDLNIPLPAIKKEPVNK